MIHLPRTQTLNLMIFENDLCLSDEPPMSCTIYSGVYGTCKYVCDPDEEKAYGVGECKGRICCYHGYPTE